MISIETLLVFLAASVMITLAPGPDNLFVLTQGISKGRRAALVAAWGMCSGVSIHTTAAALGISALIYASSAAFMAIKYLGALYLFYLAYVTIRDRGWEIESSGGKEAKSDGEMFRRGFLMNVLNPKVGIFFLAFLPQFVEVGSQSRTAQMLVLGGVFMLQALVIFSLLAYFAGSVGAVLLRNDKVRSLLSWFAASVFVALGAKLVLESK